MRQQPTFLFVRKKFITIAGNPVRARIGAGEKTGAARSANWALAIGMCESHPFAGESVETRRIDVRVAQRVNRIKTLLVAAIPKDIRSIGHSLCFFADVPEKL